jgi:chromosome segregation ATPase
MDSVFVNPPIEIDIESLMGHIRQGARLRHRAPMKDDSRISEQDVLHDRDEHDNIGGAFLAQAELNRSLVQSLAALGQNLQDVQGRFSILEREFRAKTEGGAKASQELSDQINPLYNSHNTSLEAISKRIDGIAAPGMLLEDKITQKLQELQDSVQVTQAAIDELSGRVESVVARISAVEYKLHSLVTVEQRLPTEADRTAEVERQIDEQPGQPPMIEEFGK